MEAIQFQEVNTFLKAEGCLDLPAFVGVQPNGCPFIITGWQPNEEDKKAILSGKPIFVTLLTNVMPPIQLFTTNAEGELN